MMPTLRHEGAFTRPPGTARRSHETPGGPRRAVRVLALAAALAALLAVAACGPGLGGTGTGATQEAVAAFGAREVPVCEAEFADLLGCARPAVGAAPLPAAQARFFAEATPASRTLLELDGQQAELKLRCAALVFIGAFAQVGGAAPRYYGNTIEGGNRVRLATLVVQRSGSGAGSGLTVTLTDSLGATLFGPQALQPVGGATIEAPCP
jgi:hypothetical protein